MFVLLHELNSRKKSFIIWLLCLLVLVVSMFSKAELYVSEPNLSSVFTTLPKPIISLFGMTGYDLTTYSGFYAIGFIYFVIATCVYSISIFNSLFNDEIISSSAEYLYSKPKSREYIYVNKVITGLILITLINLFITIASISYGATFNVSGLISDILLIHLNIYFINLLFIGIMLLIIKLRRTSVGIYGVMVSVLLITYFIDVIYNSFDNVGWLFYLSPFSFLSPVLIFNEELNYFIFVVILGILISGIVSGMNSFKKFEF